MSNPFFFVFAVLVSGFFAFFPAIFGTVIAFMPLSQLLEFLYKQKETTLYAANANSPVLTGAMVKAQMAAKFPLLYHLKYNYSGAVLVGLLYLIWQVSFCVIFVALLVLRSILLSF
jgi:hypothetical protein